MLQSKPIPEQEQPMKALRGGLLRRCRAGFSLIEVLVAMTILSIIVLIVSGIFQQTSLAWTIGLRRADAQSVTRAVVGAINRDLAMMVDPANFVIYPAKADSDSQKDACDAGDIDPECTLSNTLSFWILRPVDLSKSKISDIKTCRELVRVTYSGGSQVKRSEETFNSATGGTSSSGNPATYRLGNGSVTFASLSGVDYDGFASLYETGGVKITVKPQTPATISDYEIGVGSAGPDGKWGTDDDICPWVKGEN